MSRILRQLLDLWKQLGLNQRLSLTLAAGAIVAVMAGILVWSSRPDLELLWNRLDPKDVSAIAGALEEQGVAFRIGAGSTAIYVPRDQAVRLRADLMAKGFNSGGVVGYEIFDRGNFGISDFVQRTNNLRAIQGELSRTIGQLDGVRSARVMVVMPENRLLVADNTRRSTASVLVDTGGRRLELEAVDSIRSLVANAVEGLQVDDVVVVDNRGNVLSAELRSDNLGSGLTSGQIRYRTSLEDYFTRKVETMLSTVLGPGNAVVRVSVDVNHTSTSTTEERFDPESQVVRNSTVTEDTTSSTEAHDRAGTAVGVAANGGANPGEGDAGPPVTRSQQKRVTKTENFEIARSTINTVRAPGDIERLSAAVFVAMRSTGTGEARQPQPRTPEELNALRTMVVNALGVAPPAGRNASLDQVVSIEEVDFANDPLVAAAPEAAAVPLTTWIEIGQKVLVLVLAVVGFLFFLRLLRRSQAEAPSLELYSAGGPGRPGELPAEVTPEMLNELIRQKPGNVGLTLKRWMSAEQQ